MKVEMRKRAWLAPRRRRWLILALLGTIALCVALAMVVATTMHLPRRPSNAVTESGTSVSADKQVRVSVFPGAAPSTRFTFERGDAPLPTAPVAQALGHAVNIKATGLATGSEVGFRFDPQTDLPAAAGKVAPTAKNAAIMVFNDTYQVWTALPTRYDQRKRELVASAPHFSWYQIFYVQPGNYVVQQGLAAADVVVTATTTVLEVTRQTVVGLVADLFRNALGQFDESRHSCRPVSSQYRVATRNTLGGSKLSACPVSTGAGAGAQTKLAIRNAYALPLAFTVGSDAGGIQFAPPDLDGFEIGEMLAVMHAASRGALFVPRLNTAAVLLDPASTRTATLTGELDMSAVALDVAAAALAVLLTRGKKADEKVTILYREVLRVVYTQRSANVTTRISLSQVHTIAITVARQKGLTTSLQQFMAGIDLAGCVSSGIEAINNALRQGTAAGAATALAQLVESCAGSALHASGRELAGAVAGIASQLRVLPEIGQLMGVAVVNFVTRGDITHPTISATRTDNVARYDGYGAYRLGMSRSQMLAAAPTPLRRTFQNNFCEEFSARQGDPDADMQITVHQGTIARIIAPPSARTAARIQIGANRAALATAYPDRLTPFDDQGGPVLLAPGPNMPNPETLEGEGVFFRMSANGTVLGISVGASEGWEICSGD